MRILITGGLGTVGKPLTVEFQNRGHDVTVCDLLHNHGENYERCDVGEYRQLARLFKNRKFDYVYHLAAEFGRWNGEDFYEQLWMTNVIGTKNIIRFQESEGFRLVFLSSSEVYGDWNDVMVEEVMDHEEIRQLNDYAMTKWVGENQVMNSASQHGTESVRIRLFNTYGPGEYYSSYRSAICQFIYHAIHDLPYTVYLGHTRTSTYISDIVRTLANVSENFTSGNVYNIAGTEVHDMKAVSDDILAYLGKSDELVKYVEGEAFTTKHKLVDASKAVKDLKHECLVSLEDGLARTIDWMAEEYRRIKGIRWD